MRWVKASLTHSIIPAGSVMITRSSVALATSESLASSSRATFWRVTSRMTPTTPPRGKRPTDTSAQMSEPSSRRTRNWGYTDSPEGAGPASSRSMTARSGSWMNSSIGLAAAASGVTPAMPFQASLMKTIAPWASVSKTTSDRIWMRRRIRFSDSISASVRRLVASTWRSVASDDEKPPVGPSDMAGAAPLRRRCGRARAGLPCSRPSGRRAGRCSYSRSRARSSCAPRSNPRGW